MPRRRREPVPQQGAFFYTLPPGMEIVVLDPNEIPVSNAHLYPLLGNEPSDEGIIVGPGTDNDIHLTFADPTTICKILLNGELNDVTITSTRPDGSVTILVVEVRHRGVWVSDLFKPEPVLGIRISANERSKITQIELSKAVMPSVPLSEARVTRMIAQGTASHDGEYTYDPPTTVRNALEQVGLYGPLTSRSTVVRYIGVEDVDLNNALAEDGQLFFPRERFNGIGESDHERFFSLLSRDMLPSNPHPTLSCRILPPDVARITIPLRRPMYLSEIRMTGHFRQITIKVMLRDRINSMTLQTYIDSQMICRHFPHNRITKIIIEAENGFDIENINISYDPAENVEVRPASPYIHDALAPLIDIPDREVRVPTELEVIERIVRDPNVPQELRARALDRMMMNGDTQRQSEALLRALNTHPNSTAPPIISAVQRTIERLSDSINDGVRNMANPFTNPSDHSEDEELVDLDENGEEVIAHNEEIEGSAGESVQRLREATRRNAVRNRINDAPLDTNLFTDPISQNVYRREFRTIEMGQVIENTLGIHSSCARYDVPNGVDFMFAPDQKPLMRIFPAHDTTPPDGWEGRMNIRIHVYDACMAVRRGTLYEGRYEDFLKPQTPEDNHYHPQVRSVRASPGDTIMVVLESPDVVIDPTRTRFRLQTWHLIRMTKRRVNK